MCFLWRKYSQQVNTTPSGSLLPYSLSWKPDFTCYKDIHLVKMLNHELNKIFTDKKIVMSKGFVKNK